MAGIPPTPSRISNLMASRLALGNLARTNIALFGAQQELATGRSILRPSDDIVKAATIGVIDDRLDRSAQLRRNLNHADSAISQADSVLSEASDLALQAKSIAAEQLTATSGPTERAGQAAVVDGLLRGLFNSSNRQGVAGYVLGASQGASPPVAAFLGGYRYLGTGAGVTTDLGLAADAPLTLAANNPLARTSTRVQGAVDLNPALTSDTRLADLTGARGLGVTLGTIQFSVNGGPLTDISLAGSDTIEDVRLRVEASLRRYEVDTGTTVLGPGGVSLQGGAIHMDVVGGTTPASVEFHDIGTGVTAQDLGLAGSPPTHFTAASADGVDLQPRLTWRTPVSAMSGVPSALGTLRISNGGHSAQVDLSGAQTLQDIRNRIEGTNLGVRVEINHDATGIDIVNELSCASSASLSISEVAGGSTATMLGVRTLDLTTRLSDFNFGRGVQIVDNVSDPTTGQASTSLNEDFVITLGNAARTQISIDLRPQDVVNVQSLLDRINAQSATQLAAAGLPTTSLVAGLAADGNGIRLTQDATFTSAPTVEGRNNSPAAQQLGLTSGTFDASSASLIASDRATVRVDSLFTHLIDLREALTHNDTNGIALAGSEVDTSIGEIAELRGVVGGHAQRVAAAATREEDRATLDETIRSGLRDSDYTQAATRFTMLQTQLEAGLRVTAMASQQSLLDFLS